MKKVLAIVLGLMLVLTLSLPAVAVSSIPAKSIALDKSKVTLLVGQTSNLKVTFSPANTTQTKLTYTTNNKNVATVNASGQITAVHSGTTTVTVYTVNNKILAKCLITVTLPKAVTVKYLTWNYADTTKSTDSWIKYLKDKNNITINMQNIPTDQYSAVFKVHYVSNDMPDLVMVHSIGPDLISEKAQLKADTFIDISGLSSIPNYIPSVLDSVKTGGKLYYVPISTNVLGVLYNKKVFSTNGISIPTNIKEFTQVCDKLLAANIKPIASGAKDSWTTQIIPFISFGQYVDGKDTSIRNKLADGSMKYADIKQDMQKVLPVQQDWAKKGYFQDNFLGTDINVACQLVGTGKAGMLINGTWELKAVQDTVPKGQFGFFALPLNAPGEKIQVPTNANGGLSISATSPNIASAKTALDYFLSAGNQALLMNDLNGISTNTLVNPSDPFLKEVSKAMAGGNVQPVWWGCNGLYFPGATSFKIDVQLQALLAEGTTVDKFITDFDNANAKVFQK